MGVQRWQKWAIGIAAACALLFLVAVVAAQPIARAVAGAGARAMGYNLSYDALSIHLDRASARNLSIRTTGGEPVAEIDSLDARYSIPDALRNTRMFGFEYFDVERPRITLIRHKDGSWNVPTPKQQQGGGPGAPMIFAGKIANGSVDVFDQAQGVPSARHLMIRNVNVAMDVATNARTTYTAGLDYLEAGQRYPLRGSGRIDVQAGYGTQRWSTAEIPIAHIVDVGLNSPSMHIVGGSLRNVDARIVALGKPGGSLDQHMDATAYLDKARIAIGGLRKPLRDVHGPLAVYGDGLLLQSISATMAGMPVRLGGGVYHLTSPAFRLTVDGKGDLHQLRTVIGQSSSLPVSGSALLNVLVEGHPSKPLVLIGISAPRVHYATAFIDNASGLIAFDGQEADVANFNARYKGVGMSVRGKVGLHPKQRALEVVAGVDAPPSAIPYSSAIVPALPLHASILATSDTLRNIDGRGILVGSSGASNIAGVFDVTGGGVGTVGPVRITRPGGSTLYATAFVDRPHQHIDALVDASHFRLTMPQLSATLDGRIAGSYANGKISAGGWSQFNDIRTAYTTIARADARFGETDHHSLALAVDASGIGALGAVATAMMTYSNGTVNVRDASASGAGTFVDARGSIANLAKGAPRYDLSARMHSADLSSLVAVAQPSKARLLEGSAVANVHVVGTGTRPSVAGSLHAPEGAVNGLPFHALDASFGGTPTALAIQNGGVDVGSTDVDFSGSYSPSLKQMSISSQHADLADFNDFFDQGDMLAGTGRIAADVAMAGTSIRTNGDVALHNTQLRNFSVGAATARWKTASAGINTALAFGGPNGTVHAAGIVRTDRSISGMTIRARNVNVGNWLAMGGFAMPVTGIADADATVSGRFPSINGSLHAHARNASLNRIPIDAVDVAAALAGHRGTLRSFSVRLPNATAGGSGSFGLLASDTLALAFNAQTPNIGALTRTLTGRVVDAAGAVRTTVAISGTRLHPRVDDRFTADRLRYARFKVPHAQGEVRADERTIALTGTQVNLERGRMLLAGNLPVDLKTRQIDPHDRPIALSMTADDIEASNFVPLLPDGTHATGRLDGTVTVGGTVHAPRMGGMISFAKGSFSSPMERVPIRNVGAQLAFSGTSATLQNTHADVGHGTIDADGRASIPDVRDANKVSLQLNARANHANIDAPQYVKGTFDSDIHISKRPGTRPMLAGTVQTNTARIPLTALYNPKSSNAPAPPPPDIGLGLHIVAGRDVRVQSPNVDVGAEGYLDVKGTLPHPVLAGTFVSTGGTVSFMRTFRIQRGTVTFDPSGGIMPYVDAVATTHVDNPPTEVALEVHGPATQLNIAFASQPPYDREQILGLLVNAQSLGAVHGVAATGNGGAKQNAIAGLAQGQLNQLFTRNLLEPFDVAAGGALGLSNLQITNDLQGGFGVNAVKALGKTVNFIYADTFSLPRRESITVAAHPSDAMEVDLTTYNTQGQSLLALQSPTAVNALQPGFGNTTTIPMDTGQSGVDLKLEKKFP